MDDTVVRFGLFELDLLRRELRSRTGTVPLGSRAFDTLAVLVQHHGETVGRAALMQTVWPGRVVEENNLVQAIRSVRQALCAHGPEHDYVVTVAGRGYRFVAPLHRERSGFRYALAVLPLHDADAQAGDARAKGFTDALVAVLSARSHVPVRSALSCAGLPLHLDAVTAGRRLCATHVVEGALQSIGHGIRLSLRLLEVDSALAPWSCVMDIRDDLWPLASITDQICAHLPVNDRPVIRVTERRQQDIAWRGVEE